MKLLELGRKQIIPQGEVSSPLDRPGGCVFHRRCLMATAECRDVAPDYREHFPGRGVACHPA